MPDFNEMDLALHESRLQLAAQLVEEKALPLCMVRRMCGLEAEEAGEVERSAYGELEDLPLMDERLLTSCLAGLPDCAEHILGTIWNRPDLEFRRVRTHVPMHDFMGRPVYRIPVVAETAEGDLYTLGVSNGSRDEAIAETCLDRRMMCLDILTWCDEPDRQPDVYVARIASSEPLNPEKAVLFGELVSDQTEIELDDGTHLAFVNGLWEGDDDMGKLMADMRETDTDDMRSALLAERVEEVRAWTSYTGAEDGHRVRDVGDGVPLRQFEKMERTS